MSDLPGLDLARFTAWFDDACPGDDRAQARGVSFREQEQDLLRSVSLRSYVTPQDITNMALYLCSPFGATISGQALAVDGDMQSLV